MPSLRKRIASNRLLRRVSIGRTRQEPLQPSFAAIGSATEYLPSSTEQCLIRLLELQADYIVNPLLCADQISMPEALLKDHSDLWDSASLIEMCEELLTRPFPLK